MSTHVRVDVGDVVMSTGVATAFGCEWLVTSVDGWDSAEAQIATLDPTGRPGTVVAASDSGPRWLLVNGAVFAASQSNALAAWRFLTGAMPGIGGSTQLTVYEDVPMVVDVTQGGKHVAPSPVGGFFEFTLNLLAPVPFKRALSPTSASISAGGSVSVTNNGTAPAFVSVTATSAGSVRVRQVSSGQVLRTRASVASGTVFDAQSRTVRSAGGFAVYGVMDSPSEWLSIPRGATVSLANEGSASVSVSFFDTYA